ncbi:hypothetical protein DAPPUDRAFT_249385 [Daphnia pulex]|uniref:Threonyl/alanyl tRNA synthetase SAD domain-containing protein n=1 Tax=Daphnia pulex TaxID=6669 RepID=E9GWK0_DAPPU|nr:hypothetical protein DAPPUDRAFT_249385 [Daphnia pulex]|eukprot:EFX76114.1 hypothetical protein DAPPUDRAFT_249385 [Daphnia pulex]
MASTSVTDAQLITFESQANEKIREAVSVEVEVRYRGLPDGYVGPVHVITILGVDSNMRCGTHVSNPSHLQLFYTKKDYINHLLESESQLTKILKNGPEDLVDLANNLQASVKLSQKEETNINEKSKFAIIHSKDGDTDYASVLISEMDFEELVLITIGGYKTDK